MLIFFLALFEEKLLDQLNISRISGIRPYQISGRAIWYPAGYRISIKAGLHPQYRVTQCWRSGPGSIRTFCWIRNAFKNVKYSIKTVQHLFVLVFNTVSFCAQLALILCFKKWLHFFLWAAFQFVPEKPTEGFAENWKDPPLFSYQSFIYSDSSIQLLDSLTFRAADKTWMEFKGRRLEPNGYIFQKWRGAFVTWNFTTLW
jgi:hypothetical protein